MKIYAGFGLYGLLLLFIGPDWWIFHREYLHLTFAVWVLAPLNLSVLERPVNWSYYLAAALLTVGLLLPPNPWNAVLTLPYAGLVLYYLFHSAKRPVSHQVVLFYWLTGALATGVYLSGFRPFDYPPIILLLTANHFHVAGFGMGTLALYWFQQRPNAVSRSLAIGLLSGMAMVAAGIFIHQLGGPWWLEAVPAALFALLAAGLAAYQGAQVRQRNFPVLQRLVWTLSSGSLLTGMVMAILYALRDLWPLSYIHIPNMITWHGSLNAFGFAGLGLWMAAASAPQTLKWDGVVE